MEEIKLKEKPSSNTLGVVVGRFQVHELTEGHEWILSEVGSKHNKMAIFLGVSMGAPTRENPMDYMTRMFMLRERYPDVIIEAIGDVGNDIVWSRKLDAKIADIHNGGAILYGSRDSFISKYHGIYVTEELNTPVFASGTEVRNNLSDLVRKDPNFRAGVIYANYNRYPIAYPTVDVACFDGKGSMLLAKKPNERLWRFIGGFVSPTDNTLETAARREFKEETGNCEIEGLKYVTSHKVHDWRYRGTADGIMTSLFAGIFVYGSIKPSDDVAELRWLEVEKLRHYDGLTDWIVEEHRIIMDVLLKKYDNNGQLQK